MSASPGRSCSEAARLGDSGDEWALVALMEAKVPLY